MCILSSFPSNKSKQAKLLPPLLTSWRSSLHSGQQEVRLPRAVSGHFCPVSNTAWRSHPKLLIRPLQNCFPHCPLGPCVFIHSFNYWIYDTLLRNLLSCTFHKQLITAFSRLFRYAFLDLCSSLHSYLPSGNHLIPHLSTGTLLSLMLSIWVTNKHPL